METEFQLWMLQFYDSPSCSFLPCSTHYFILPSLSLSLLALSFLICGFPVLPGNYLHSSPRVCGRSQWNHHQLQGHQEISGKLSRSVHGINHLSAWLVCDVLSVLYFQEERGFVFESDTDTEVIPKLMKYLYDTQVIALCKCEKLLSALCGITCMYTLLSRSILKC